MKPPGHAAISLVIGGAIWGVTKSPYAMVASVLTGTMIDLDHLVEYYRLFVKEDRTRVYYFLHSYELLVPAFLSGYLSGWDPVVMGVAFAFLGHLLTDQFANPVSPLAYFFTYRAIKGFRREAIVKVEWEDLRKDFLSLPATRTILGFFSSKMKTSK